ncbi:muscarinic acetylcholine receptor DM1 [Hetaerina americana]|uniref:muscarinic acetylcholine receptor DM1 n=1 Tax=Hetaerina americana TaxID=62018 RepID=UPI003A7F4780
MNASNFSLGGGDDGAGGAAEGGGGGHYSVQGTVLIAIVAGALSVVTVAGNSMVMISFKIDKQLQTISNYFLFSLAVADMGIGLISMPLFTVYTLMGHWPLGPHICDTWLALDYLASNASVLNLLIISFDRYFSVTRPLTYRAKRTTARAALMIGCAWGISLLLWPPWIYSWPYIEGERTIPDTECYIQFIETNHYITFGTAIAAFYVPVSVMIFLYWRIWRETEKRQKDLPNLQAGKEGCSRRSNSSDEAAVDLGEEWKRSRSESSTGGGVGGVSGGASLLTAATTTTTTTSLGGGGHDDPDSFVCRCPHHPQGLPAYTPPPPQSFPPHRLQPYNLPSPSDSGAPRRALPFFSWRRFREWLWSLWDPDDEEDPVPCPAPPLPHGVAERSRRPRGNILEQLRSHFLGRRGHRGRRQDTSSGACGDTVSEPGSATPLSADTPLASSVSRATSLNVLRPFDPCCPPATPTRLPPPPPPRRCASTDSVYTILIRLPSEGNESSSGGAAIRMLPDSASARGAHLLPTAPSASSIPDLSLHPRGPLQARRPSSAHPTPRHSGAPRGAAVVPAAKTRKKKKTQEKKAEKKAAKTLSAILLAFIITWTPYNILVLLKPLTACTKCIPQELWDFFYYLCYINSTINPVCYALCNASFRRTYVRILTCKWHNRNRSAVNRGFYN